MTPEQRAIKRLRIQRYIRDAETDVTDCEAQMIGDRAYYRASVEKLKKAKARRTKWRRMLRSSK